MILEIALDNASFPEIVNAVQGLGVIKFLISEVSLSEIFNPAR